MSSLIKCRSVLVPEVAKRFQEEERQAPLVLKMLILAARHQSEAQRQGEEVGRSNWCLSKKEDGSLKAVVPGC